MRAKKTMRIVIIIIALFILGSCATVDYIGKSYPETSNVEIYFSVEEIMNSYKTIGYAVGYREDYETIMGKLISEAKTKGADAIIITGIDIEIGNDSSTKKINASLIKYLE